MSRIADRSARLGRPGIGLSAGGTRRRRHDQMMPDQRQRAGMRRPWALTQVDAVDERALDAVQQLHADTGLR